MNGAKLPLPEDQFLEMIRSDLASRAQTTSALARFVRLPLRLGTCIPLHNGIDGGLSGYRVTVLVDPKPGVPVDQPGAEPSWGARTVLVFTVGPNGDRVLLSSDPHIESDSS